MRATATTTLRTIALLTLCATALIAQQANPAARSHATAKQAAAWDAAYKARITASAAKAAQVKTAGEHAAASRTLVKAALANAAQNRSAAGSEVNRTASARAQSVAADAATVQRVHAWEESQQRAAQAAALAAAQAAIKAADRTMDQAMRSGEAPADPVLWTAEAVFPKDTNAPAGAVIAMDSAGAKGDAANLTGAAAGESAAGHSAAAVSPANAVADKAAAANAGAASSSAGNPVPTATTAALMPSLYNSRGSLVVPAPLFGSREILLHQNEMAEDEGIDRVRDDAELATLRREKKLVALPANETVHIDERLPENRRYARPWAANFVTAFARDYYAVFHEPLKVNSAVRTVAFQRHLERTNGNAAAATGDAASPHLTGEAVDIAKHGLTLAEIAWMRAYLQPLIEQGKIDVEEEFQQACFHISVYERYLPGAGPRFNYAASRQGAGLP